jgi:predicted nucleic acid-binding protein
MNYLFDSNTISDLYDKDSLNYEQIAQQLADLTFEDHVFISVISLYEFEYGYSNAPEGKKILVRKMIDEAKQDFNTLPLAEEGSVYFGRLKKSLVNTRQLKKESAKKHNIDIILASTAIINSCILISADEIYTDLKNHFQYEDLISENI